MKKALKKEPVLLILLAGVATAQVILGYRETGEWDANLIEAAITTVGAVLVRFRVFSPQTMDELLTNQERITDIYKLLLTKKSKQQ
jgi:hypothetical protein